MAQGDYGYTLSSGIHWFGYISLADAGLMDIACDPEDSECEVLAMNLAQLGYDVLEIDEAWCEAVSTVGMNGCYANDGLIPTYSQNLGRGFNTTISPENSIYHTAEIYIGDVVLPPVLRTNFGISDR